jgi:hypothetical protein
LKRSVSFVLRKRLLKINGKLTFNLPVIPITTTTPINPLLCIIVQCFLQVRHGCQKPTGWNFFSTIIFSEGKNTAATLLLYS